jgi:hypothetical protein
VLAANLTHVPKLLRSTGIAYLDLIELLKTRFLNPVSAITLDSPDGADPCDIDQMTVSPLDDNILHKLHRFIRLWTKLGWQMRDLDKAIAALGAADIDDALLLSLAATVQLQADLKMPLDQLLSFWSAIDADGRDSLYIRLFQNRAVLKPVDPAFELRYVATLDFQLSVTFPDSVQGQLAYDPAALQLSFTGAMTSSQRDDLLKLSSAPGFQRAVNGLYEMRAPANVALANPTGFISDHVNTIVAALRISAKDLEAIRMAGLTDPDTNNKVALTFANLSVLYRHAALASTAP